MALPIRGDGWYWLPVALGVQSGVGLPPLGAFCGGLVRASRVNPSISEGGGVVVVFEVTPAVSEVDSTVVATVVASE